MTRVDQALRQRLALLRTKLFWGRFYDWSAEGDEWSGIWGDTSQMWWGMLYPRVNAYLPTATVLEIAPGFGRCSQYLVLLSERLILVDIAKACIDACEERFAEFDHVEYHTNDGKSLEMVEDAVVDVVFSYDSLVHVPMDVMEAYIGQLSRILRPDGVAFLHHSNLGAYEVPGNPAHDKLHGRDTSTSAVAVRDYAASVGLSCFTQELFRWGEDERYSDAISVIARPGSAFDREREVFENDAFAADAKVQARLLRRYGAKPPE
jgi:SAM-dependent methyltransferase